jgi:hypothetical protein
VLKKIQQEKSDLEIKKIDIIRHPRTTIKDEVTMIPTLQIGEKRLSGIFLSEKEIREFIEINSIDL